MKKKIELGVMHLVLKIKRAENKSNFEKWARLNQHGLQGLSLKYQR